MSHIYPTNSSGLKTSSAQIATRQSFLSGIDMISPSSGTATLTIYDSSNSSTSGKLILAEMEVDAGMPSCNHEYSSFINANQGIYATLSYSAGATADASYIIRYALG